MLTKKYKFEWWYILIIYPSIYFISEFILKVVFHIDGFKASPLIRGSYSLSLLTIYAFVIFQKNLIIKKYTQNYSKFLNKILLISPLWFIIGLFNINIYTFTDLLYLLLIYGSYYFTRKTAENIEEKELLQYLIYFTLFLTTVQIISIYFTNSTGSIFYIYLSTFSIIFIIKSRTLKNKIISIYAIIPILLTLSNINRSLIIQIISISFLIFFIINIKGKVKFLLSIIFLVLIFLIIKNFGYYNFLNSKIERRYEETINIFQYGISEEISIPMQQRIYEAETVFEIIYDNPLILLFGKGFGATVDMTESSDSSVISSQIISADKTHNIHILPISIIYRYGLIGITMYFLIIFRAFINILKIKKYQNRTFEFEILYLISNFYIISLFSYSFMASSIFFTDPLFGIFLAVSDNLSKK